MHDLVVAVFQITVDLDVLDVELCEVGEDLIVLPLFDVLEGKERLD